MAVKETPAEEGVRGVNFWMRCGQVSYDDKEPAEADPNLQDENTLAQSFSNCRVHMTPPRIL